MQQRQLAHAGRTDRDIRRLCGNADGEGEIEEVPIDGLLYLVWKNQTFSLVPPAIKTVGIVDREERVQENPGNQDGDDRRHGPSQRHIGRRVLD